MELDAIGQGSVQPPLDRTVQETSPADSGAKTQPVDILAGGAEANPAKSAEAIQTIPGNPQDKLSGIGNNINIVA